jgi:NAD(P)-dependent dehydrogenase (short-subunit alcohol dehydrogenase family)
MSGRKAGVLREGRLANKVAIISGGAGGIGSAAARLFCKEGARVALVDLDAASLRAVADTVRSETDGAELMCIATDLREERSAQDIVSQVLKAYGGISVLVNNAGIRRYEALADAPWEAWEDIIRLNLLSVASLSRAALPALRQSGKGSIINVSSTYAVYGRKGMGAYDATKSAVLSLTRTLAYEEATHGVRANAICPGFTRTPFHIQRLGVETVEKITPPCVMKRWADPMEMAYPMLWLASDEASYVTAATLMVDGGLPE